jgi:hypothetical protein
MEDKSSILKKYFISRMLGNPKSRPEGRPQLATALAPECVGLAMPLHSEQGRLHYCVLNRQVLAPRMTDQSAISRHCNLTPENQILGRALPCIVINCTIFSSPPKSPRTFHPHRYRYQHHHLQPFIQPSVGYLNTSTWPLFDSPHSQELHQQLHSQSDSSPHLQHQQVDRSDLCTYNPREETSLQQASLNHLRKQAFINPPKWVKKESTTS